MLIVTWIRRLFQLPIFDDVEQTRKAAVLHCVALAIFIAALPLFAIVTILYPADLLLYFAEFAFLSTLTAAVQFLMRRGQVAAASALFLSTLWLLTTLIVGMTGFSGAPFYSGYLLIVLLAGVLLGRRASVMVMTLSILWGLALLMQETGGQPADSGAWAAYTLFLYLVLFLLLHIINQLNQSSLEAAIRRAQQSERELLERNQQLEAEIEARREAEAALRRSEARYRLLTAHFPNGAVVLFDRDLRYLLADGTGLGDLGLTKESAEGRTLPEILPADVVAQIEPDYRAALNGETRVSEVAFGDITYLAYTLPVRDENGAVIAGLRMTQNITERKRLEAQQLALALEQERANFLTDFLTNLGHDLRTPLTMISTSVYLAERYQDAEKRQEKLDLIKRQVALLEKYLQDMTMVAFLENIPIADRDPVHLNALLTSTADYLRAAAARKNITVQHEMDDHPTVLHGSSDELYQMLVHLIENAVRFTPPGGTITLRKQYVEGRIVIELEDTGIGIHEEDLPYIFDRFYRGDKSRSSSSGGTGLGLTLVRKIVERHNGQVEVSSRPGLGSAFRVIFPSPHDRPQQGEDRPGFPGK